VPTAEASGCKMKWSYGYHPIRQLPEGANTGTHVGPVSGGRGPAAEASGYRHGGGAGVSSATTTVHSPRESIVLSGEDTVRPRGQMVYNSPTE